MENKTHGPSKEHELDFELLHRDVRTTFQKFRAWWNRPSTVDFVAIALLILLVALPAFTEVFVFFGLLLCLKVKRMRGTLPLRLPSTANIVDYNDPKPGTEGEYFNSRGILCLGRDRVSGEEIWLSNDDARRHGLTIGTTGSGKTEYKLGLIANSMCWSSGFIFMDGKADVKLWESIRSLARRFGRDDDLLILNFMQGGKETGGNSHTINPFATTSTSMINNLIESLLPPGGGSNDMWQKRAQAFSAAVNRLLVDLRNQKHLLFNAFTLSETMPLKTLVAAFYGRRIEMGLPGSPNHQVIANYRLSSKTREELKRYLESLSAFNWAKAQKGEPQDTEPEKQHGFLVMQFTKILTTLATSYDYIFQKPVGEIELNDVVINRRILVVLLPSLEKSSDETSSLGKITIAMLKAMMATSLGDQIEGYTREIIDNRPTTSMSPMPAIFDESGYYFVFGMAVMTAQARSLGFSLWFGAQDDQAMRREGGEIDKEVNAVIANTNTKSFGKVEDPDNTFMLAQKSGGETHVGRAAGFSQRLGALDISNVDRGDVQIEKVHRVSYDDLKGQREGQFHIMYGNTLVRANVIYIPLLKMNIQRRTRFITVRPPEHAVRNLQKEAIADAIATRISRPDWSIAGRLSSLHMAGSRVTPLLQASSLDHVAAIWARSEGHANPCNRAAATLCALVFEDRFDWRAGKSHFTEELDGDLPALPLAVEDLSTKKAETSSVPDDVTPPVNNRAAATIKAHEEEFYTPPPQEIDVIEDVEPSAEGASVQAGQSPIASPPGAFPQARADRPDDNSGIARTSLSEEDESRRLERAANAVRGNTSPVSNTGTAASDQRMRAALVNNLLRATAGNAVSKSWPKKEDTSSGDDQGDDTGDGGSGIAEVHTSDSFIKTDAAPNADDAHLYSSEAKPVDRPDTQPGKPRSVGFDRVQPASDINGVPFDAHDYDEGAQDAVLGDHVASDDVSDDQGDIDLRAANMMHCRLRSRLAIAETVYGLETMRVGLSTSGQRAHLRSHADETLGLAHLRNVIADGIDAYTADHIDPASDDAQAFFGVFRTWKSFGSEGFTPEESKALVDAIAPTTEIGANPQDFVVDGAENPLMGQYRQASLSLWETPEIIRRVVTDIKDIGLATGQSDQAAQSQMEELVAVAVSKAVPPARKHGRLPSGNAARDVVFARIGKLITKKSGSGSGAGETSDNASSDDVGGEIVDVDLGSYYETTATDSKNATSSNPDAGFLMAKFRANKQPVKNDERSGDDAAGSDVGMPE